VKTSLLIPAKGFANAKQRLSSLLSVSQRSILAETMLKDVLRQVVLVRGLEAIFVVTGDSRVADIVSSMGGQVIWEEEERGETPAVPADIPLVHSSDVEEILGDTAARDRVSPFALLVPSHDRMGTNGLLLSPPDLIQLRFGYDSFSYHLSQVAAQGLTPLVLENERIGLDIDEPEDLERYLSLGAVGETYSTLVNMGMGLQRL